MLEGLVSIISLSIVAALCVIGVFHPNFDDTLGQRLGMSLIGIWCILRIQVKLTSLDTEPVHLILHIGLMCYACGTALKIWRARRFADRHRRTVRQLQELDEVQRGMVAGGSAER